MSKNPTNENQPGLWEVPAGLSRRKQREAAAPARHIESNSQRKRAPLLPTKRPLKPMELRELWDIDDVANYLGVPKQTIYSWRQTSYGPKAFRVGKHLRWRAKTVIEWTLGLEREP